jgi:hypothetical protein
MPCSTTEAQSHRELGKPGRGVRPVLVEIGESGKPIFWGGTQNLKTQRAQTELSQNHQPPRPWRTQRRLISVLLPIRSISPCYCCFAR